MTSQSNEIAQLRHDVAALQNTLDALDTPPPKARGGPLRRVIAGAAVVLAASGLAFGALTAAGVEAFHIDEQGSVHILGAVIIGGAATVGSLTTSGAVSGASLSATGPVSGTTVTSTGLLTAGSMTTGGEIAATKVTAATIEATTLGTSGTLTANNANVGGVIVDANGNMAIPGNLNVAGLNDRLTYANSTPNQTTFIDAGDLARLCADGDGCEVRLAMLNYDTINTAPASVVTWLYCDANCKKWRTSAQLLDTSVGQRSFGTDANQVINHVIQAWDCYFTDAEYVNRVGTDDQVGFGLLKWVDAYPTSNCSLAIID